MRRRATLGALVALLANLVIPSAALAICTVCASWVAPFTNGAQLPAGSHTFWAGYDSLYNPGTLRITICGDYDPGCTAPIYDRSWTNVGEPLGGGYSDQRSDTFNFPAGFWNLRATASTTDMSGNPITSSRTIGIDFCNAGSCPPGPPSLVAPASSGKDVPRPLLVATFTDSDSTNTGSLQFQVCTTSACGTVVASGTTPAGVPNGALASWAPGIAEALTPGTTYWWRARATDSTGLTGTWATARAVAIAADSVRLRPDGTISNSYMHLGWNGASCVDGPPVSALTMLVEDIEAPLATTCSAGTSASTINGESLGDELIATLTDGPGNVQTVTSVNVKVAARTGASTTQDVDLALGLQKADGTPIGTTVVRTVSDHATTFAYPAAVTGLSLTAADLNGMRVVVGSDVPLAGVGEEVWIDAVSVDALYTPSGCGPCPPSTPTHVSPANGAWVSATTLTSSAYSDSDGPATQQSAQWQLRTAAGDYVTPQHDSGETTTALTSYAVPAGLAQGTQYFWRVRHRSTDGTWSAWSTETSFRWDETAPNLLRNLRRTNRTTTSYQAAWDEGTDNLTAGASMRYSAEKSSNGTTWTAVCTNTTTEACTPNLLGVASPGYFRVRATDLAGNIGPWAYYADVTAADYYLQTPTASTQVTSGSTFRIDTAPASMTGTTPNLNGSTAFWQVAPAGTAVSSASLPVTPNPAAAGRGWYLDSSPTPGVPLGMADGDISFFLNSTASKVNGEAYLRARLWGAGVSGGNLAAGATSILDSRDVTTNNLFGSTTVRTGRAYGSYATAPVWGVGQGLYAEAWVEVVTPSSASGGSMLLTFSQANVQMPPVGPVPELAAGLAPAGGATVTNDTLSANYQSLGSVAGHVRFEIAPDVAGVPGAVQEVGYSAFELAATGATGTYNPMTTTDGTQYWWRAIAQDRQARTRGATAWRTYTLSGSVNQAPTASTLVSPAAAADVIDTTPLLTATFEDPDSPETGLARFEVCSVAFTPAETCAAAGGTLAATGASSSGLLPGGSGAWSPASALANGTWYWRARGEDDGGLIGAWTAARSVRIGVGTLTITLDSVTLPFGTTLPGSDSVGTRTATIQTSYANGWTLLATDEADGWGLSIDGLGATTLADFGGPDGDPSTVDGPAAWPAGAVGVGVSVLDIDGAADSRDARWGTPTTSPYPATDFTNNHFAGLGLGTPETLAERPGYSAANDVVTLAIRTTSATSTSPGTYSGAVTLTAIATP